MRMQIETVNKWLADKSVLQLLQEIEQKSKQWQGNRSVKFPTKGTYLWEVKTGDDVIKILKAIKAIADDCEQVVMKEYTPHCQQFATWLKKCADAGSASAGDSLLKAMTAAAQTRYRELTKMADVLQPQFKVVVSKPTVWTADSLNKDRKQKDANDFNYYSDNMDALQDISAVHYVKKIAHADDWSRHEDAIDIVVTAKNVTDIRNLVQEMSGFNLLDMEKKLTDALWRTNNILYKKFRQDYQETKPFKEEREDVESAWYFFHMYENLIGANHGHYSHTLDESYITADYRDLMITYVSVLREAAAIVGYSDSWFRSKKT